MNGLMMNFPLTLAHIFDRAGKFFPRTEIVSRWPDKSIHRATYADFHRRARKFANALQRRGLKSGERVATMAWNHGRHLEAYFAIPLAGGVVHTLNPRLAPQELAYIVNHADDKVLLVDDVLLPVLEKFRKDIHPRQIIVWSHGAAAPQGTVDSFGIALPDSIGLSQTDVIMPVVPMFHVNAWGLPFACTMVGAKQVFPGPCLDAPSLLSLLAEEKVTCTAGVPTIWMGILDALDKNPGGYDLKSLRQMVVGGSAAPQAMIEAFQKRHGLRIVHAWGMTEMSPVGTLSRLKPHLAKGSESDQLRVRSSQGLAVPFVDLRAVSESGPVPWDGKSMGELQVRGPWVARSYFENPEESDKFTKDGWFRTGDVVTIDAEGYIRITDRAKDLIKSGGEWISSVDLENALMGHPAVKEAAVVAVKHPKWDERPVACVVLKEGAKATDDELRGYLKPLFAKFQLPDGFVFMAQIPRTATGKFLKTALREQLKDFRFSA